MRSSGLIYDQQTKTSFGEVRVSFAPTLRFLFRVLHVLGSAMIVVSISGFIFLFGPLIRQEISYLFIQKPEETEFGKLVDRSLAEHARREYIKSKAQELGAPNTNFSVVVPKIDARSQVLANVSPSDPSSYNEALKHGVAHAGGTVFPGISGITFLFAHSTDAPVNVGRYNAVFYLLHKLKPEDKVYVFFMDELYEYSVEEKRIVNAEDISWLARSQEGPQQLILQTCWPPGTTLKRLLVIAKPIPS